MHVLTLKATWRQRKDLCKKGSNQNKQTPQPQKVKRAGLASSSEFPWLPPPDVSRFFSVRKVPGLWRVLSPHGSLPLPSQVRLPFSIYGSSLPFAPGWPSFTLGGLQERCGEINAPTGSRTASDPARNRAPKARGTRPPPAPLTPEAHFGVAGTRTQQRAAAQVGTRRGFQVFRPLHLRAPRSSACDGVF